MTAAASGGDPGIAREVHPGPEPGMLLVHATGFCKELWRPVVTELRSLGVANRVVAVDQRGHGDSPPPPRPVDWWDLGRDALAVMAGDGGAFGLGVGHSSGGAALAMAEVLAPGTFAALVLIEPVIFPPPFRRDPGSEMAEAARRRKRGFASPAEARANYLGRGPFARWTETAVDLYVAHGMRAEGDSWVL